MSLFTGSYIYSVDAKGRINLPSKMRKSLSPESADTFTLTFGMEHCVFVYPKDNWAIEQQKLSKLNKYLPENRYVLRVMLEPVEETTLDAQSRIIIPQRHRDYAGIKDEVLILGMLEKIELWNPQAYEEYKKKNDNKTYEDVVAETLGRQE
ncbi:MAG: division/cell wall cluster transcriptional repressor MraZ [Bacteroidetes bacterium]|nr:MAG: division/cell wall cluster transcriptional repressor MraZ [Bacteroidota bacterium]